MWRLFLIVVLLFPCTFQAQTNEPLELPRYAVFVEAGGKGFLSVNYDISLGKNHRLGISLTALDYEVLNENFKDSFEVHNWWSPGLMYYYLKGKTNHFLELGAGMSISPYPGKVYDSPIHTDSPFSFHGVIGWRYQKQDHFLFRAGFTPFYRPKVWFLPLIGLSVGWSW
ncbi:MAG: hypothetical protein KDD41_11185 [Flavobacteriales bacterium]|nr:hypothetical protein [Flavobacteriales bacterium]